MSREKRMKELTTLKEIAETLNISNDMNQMLHDVLIKLLEVTGLSTGWIFLVDEEPEYICVADHNLPPALIWNNKAPMCGEDGCWCLGRYWDGKLKSAVNIINCKRIEDAIEFGWGDTQGILHHATVPLEAGGQLFGILNVATPGKDHFDDEELALLQSVAYQIGTAVNRTRLYHAQQKRAEHYSKLGRLIHQLGGVLEVAQLPGEVVRLAADTFAWPCVAFFAREGNSLALRAISSEGEVKQERHRIETREAGPVGAAFCRERTIVLQDNRDAFAALEALGIPAFRSAVAIPLRVRDELFGVLFVCGPKKDALDEIDRDVLHSLAEHVSLTFENARLYEQRRELARREERNRLARDLHDSVCQHLFSLTLMARGAESVLAGMSPVVDQSLAEIQQLTQEALKEMRALIWQLRPAGLEQGLVTALKRYGQSLGLTVHEQVRGVRELPGSVEEALWRIGQEALNNVKKHAGVEQVWVRLQIDEADVSLEVMDRGCGFAVGHAGGDRSFGLLSMRERAELFGGSLTVISSPGEYTRVKVWIPFETSKSKEAGRDGENSDFVGR